MRFFAVLFALSLAGQFLSGIAWAEDRPRIQKVSHEERPGGKSVAFYGKGFGAEEGSASIGLNNLHVYRWTNGKVEVLLPDYLPAGRYAVTLKRFDGSTVSRNVTLLPRIASFQVDGSSRPYRISITGNSFGKSGSINVGGEDITIVSWTPNLIEAMVPEHIAADWHDVYLNTGGIKVLAGQFGLPPDVSAIDVTAGTVGTTFTLTGLNFGSQTEKSMVVFGDWHNAVSAPVVAWSPFAVTAQVSRWIRPGKQPVWLWIDGVPSRRLDFQVTPSIASLRLGSDATGDVFIVLRGANFGELSIGGEVLVGGLPSVITAWTPSQLVVQIPKILPVGAHEVAIKVDEVVSRPAVLRIAPPDKSIHDGVWRGRYEGPDFDESW